MSWNVVDGINQFILRITSYYGCQQRHGLRALFQAISKVSTKFVLELVSAQPPQPPVMIRRRIGRLDRVERPSLGIFRKMYRVVIAPRTKCNLAV